LPSETESLRVNDPPAVAEAGADAEIFRTGGSTGVCRGPGPDVPAPSPIVVDVVDVEVDDAEVVDVVEVEVEVEVVDVVEVEVVVEDVVVVVGEDTGKGGGSGPPDGGAGGVLATAGSRVTGVARSALSEKVAVVVSVPEALAPTPTVAVTAGRDDPAAKEPVAVEVHSSSELPDE
jgi:hypothetical protein